jgi:hypothetical protein
LAKQRKDEGHHTEKPKVICASQIFLGIASRYVFPPDAGAWWHELGSYEMKIEKVGRIWFDFSSYCVSEKGARLLYSARRAKLDDLRREIEAGLVALKPAGPSEISLEIED